MSGFDLELYDSRKRTEMNIQSSTDRVLKLKEVSARPTQSKARSRIRRGSQQHPPAPADTTLAPPARDKEMPPLLAQPKQNDSVKGN